MGKVNYHVTQNSVTVNFDGKTLAIARGDARFPKVISAIKSGDLDLIPELVDVAASFGKDGFKLIDGQVITPTGEALPTELNARIIEFQREGLPFTHLLKFWENLKANPSYRSREQLFKFLEHNGHPLTDDGCFIAYRGVTEDFKDKHTRTFDNSPGAICEMPRDQVDDDPTRTCSAGLHAAAWEYAANWSEKRVEVKINPKDVVAVPVDYNGQKMRVCKFEVIQLCEKPLTDQALYGRENEYDESQEEVDPFEECEDCDCESDEIEESVREDIIELAAAHGQYDGDALVMRIAEDSFEDEETIRTVLEEEGLI
jgi:hypothetical protein